MMKISKSLVATLFLLSGLAFGGAAVAQEAAKAAEPAQAAAPETGYSEKGADTCLKCHEAEFETKEGAIFLSRHAQPENPRSPFGKGQLQCEACHGPGNLHATNKKDRRDHIIAFNAPASRTAGEQNQQCLACHQGKARIAWQGSAHEANEVSCASCHQVHAGRDPVFSATTQAEVCGNCHKKEIAQIRMPSAHPVRAGKVACSDCHSVHGSISGDKLLAKPTLNQTCYTCHAEKRGPLLWEHAPVAESCANCHTPHGSTNQALLKKNPPFLCQQCHAASGHPAVARTGAALPGGTAGGQGFLLAGGCTNCHSRVHGSNHPSGVKLMR